MPTRIRAKSSGRPVKRSWSSRKEKTAPGVARTTASCTTSGNEGPPRTARIRSSASAAAAAPVAPAIQPIRARMAAPPRRADYATRPCTTSLRSGWRYTAEGRARRGRLVESADAPDLVHRADRLHRPLADRPAEPDRALDGAEPAGDLGAQRRRGRGGAAGAAAAEPGGGGGGQPDRRCATDRDRDRADARDRAAARRDRDAAGEPSGRDPDGDAADGGAADANADG